MTVWRILIPTLWLVAFLCFPAKINGFALPKTYAWLLAAWMLATGCWWNPPVRQTVPNRWLGFFAFWILALFGYIVLWPQTQQDPVGYFARQVQLPWVYAPIAPTLILLGSLFATDALVRQTDFLPRWTRIAQHLIWIGLILSVWAILQVIGLDPMQFNTRMIGGTVPTTPAFTSMGNATTTGNVLAILAPLCLMFKDRRYRWGAWLVIGAGILASHSATSLLAYGVSAVVILGLQRRWRGVALLSLVSLLAVGVAHHQGLLIPFLNPEGRWAMWADAYTVWTADPLRMWFGAGPGAVGYLTTMGRWEYGTLHNDYLQLPFEYGLIGATFAVGAVILLLRQMLRTPMSGAFAAWCGAGVSVLLVAAFNPIYDKGILLMFAALIWAALTVYSHLGGVHAE